MYMVIYALCFGLISKATAAFMDIVGNYVYNYV